MDRWSGVLKVQLGSSTRNYYRVAASLCISSSSGTLAIPSANAIFFHGDKVRGSKNHVIEKMYDLQKVAEIIVSKFGNSVNAWIVEASIFNGPFAVYKDFVPSVNHWGEPKSYSPNGFPASSSTLSLLSNCIQEAKNIILKDAKEVCSIKQVVLDSHCPNTILMGFSKGGIVLNQLTSELSFFDIQEQSVMEETLSNQEKIQIIPASIQSFLRSISEFHYIDVGLNSSGAYITDNNVIQRISRCHLRGVNSIRFVLHGTPRQWCDEHRGWICEEKDELVRLLKSEAEKSGGKIQVCERFYFADRLPDLQMHFEIIDAMDIS